MLYGFRSTQPLVISVICKFMQIVLLQKLCFVVWQFWDEHLHDSSVTEKNDML